MVGGYYFIGGGAGSRDATSPFGQVGGRGRSFDCSSGPQTARWGRSRRAAVGSGLARFWAGPVEAPPRTRQALRTGSGSSPVVVAGTDAWPLALLPFVREAMRF